MSVNLTNWDCFVAYDIVNHMDKEGVRLRFDRTLEELTGYDEKTDTFKVDWLDDAVVRQLCADLGACAVRYAELAREEAGMKHEEPDDLQTLDELLGLLCDLEDMDTVQPRDDTILVQWRDSSVTFDLKEMAHKASEELERFKARTR